MWMGTPSNVICSRTVSRVVPAISVTIATSSPASALSRLDLPTFGAPTSTTLMPSRKIAPCRALAKMSANCVCSARSLPFASAASRKSMSSSGKSSVASTSIRSVIKSSTKVWICAENAPLSERTAMRAADWLDASIKSATLSACAKSSLLFRKARLVNSPASAMRAPSSKQRCSSICSTIWPPCPCNSITSSPVKLAGAAKYSSSPLSMALPWASRKSVYSAVRGFGILPPVICCANGNRFLPEMRTTPTPPRPLAVAMAAMVGGVPVDNITSIRK